MTYQEIEAFLAVVHCGSFSGAAQSLFVSQSTLSGRLQGLEQELDTVLFTRRKGMRGAELTENGRDFIPLAEKWQRLWNETRSAAARRDIRILRVASIPSVNAYIMPDVYRRFYRENPAVKLVLTSYHSFEIYHLMETGEAQMGFIARAEYSTRVDTTPLYREEMRLVCAPSARYRDGVRCDALSPDDEAHFTWGREFEAWHDYWFGAGAHPALQLDDAGILTDFVSDGDHWAVAPVGVAEAMARDNGLRVCRMADPPTPRQIFLVTPAGETLPEEGGTLLRTMGEVLSTAGGEWLL